MENIKNEAGFPSGSKLFFNRDEFASILRISLSSVDRGLRTKVPPFDKAFHIGRRVLFPASCIENLVSLESRDE